MTSLFISLYLDEDVHVLVAELLRARGFDVTTAREASQLQKSDAEQLVYAVSQGKALVTHNRVDFEALAQLYFAAGQNCSTPIISEFVENNAKGIYTFRDIRDVYTSSMKQMLKTFEQLWNEGFIENCLDNYKRWTTLPGVLVSKYEDFVENIAEEVKRIAEHIALNISLNKCQKIAEQYTVELQQQRIDYFKENLLQKSCINEDKDRKLVEHYDQKSLLHINHIESGKVGRWNEDLSVEKVALIENKVREWCMENEYEPSTFLR